MKNVAIQKMLATQYNIPEDKLSLVDVQYQATFHGDEYYFAEIYPTEFIDPETTSTIKLQLTIRVTEVK